MTRVPRVHGPEGQEACPTPTLLLSIEQVATALAIGRSAVYQLLQQEKLPVVRIGRTVRVPLDAIEAYVRGHSEGWYTRHPWQESFN